MKKSLKKLTAAVVAGTMATGFATMGMVEAAQLAPRTIVTTDGEVDDMNSFLRFLLYTNELDVEGIVYSASMWHYKGDGKGTTFQTQMGWTKPIYSTPRTDLRWCGTDWIHDYIEKYRAVYPKLHANDSRYPTADKLQSLVKVGNIDFEGEMAYDTDGSNLIKEKLLDSNDAPIYLETWGGCNTIARALKSIEEQYKGTAQWDSIYQKVSKKAVLYNIMDQDDTYKTYISRVWPDIKVWYNSEQFFSLAYIWKDVVPKEQQPYFRGPWMQKNILTGYGKAYMTYGDGHHLTGDPEDTFGQPSVAKEKGYSMYDLISEGDSPSFLYLVDNGLRSYESPAYGGWGGRFSPCMSTKNVWEDNEGSWDVNPATGEREKFYAQTRWGQAIQNDFAARVQWTQKDPKDANHAPEVSVAGGLDRTAAPGETVTITATAKDPDGDKLTSSWMQYQEAGTYAGKVKLAKTNGLTTSFTMPKDIKKGETIHLILTVTDSGTPALTHYARVIVTAK